MENIVETRLREWKRHTNRLRLYYAIGYIRPMCTNNGKNVVVPRLKEGNSTGVRPCKSLFGRSTPTLPSDSAYSTDTYQGGREKTYSEIKEINSQMSAHQNRYLNNSSRFHHAKEKPPETYHEHERRSYADTIASNSTGDHDDFLCDRVSSTESQQKFENIIYTEIKGNNLAGFIPWGTRTRQINSRRNQRSSSVAVERCQSLCSPSSQIWHAITYLSTPATRDVKNVVTLRSKQAILPVFSHTKHLHLVSSRALITNLKIKKLDVFILKYLRKTLNGFCLL